MNSAARAKIEEARRAALKILRNNSHGPYHSLPRTAGWGYPEPYTRDLMISSLGILASGDESLTRVLRRVLTTVAKNQSEHGHIPSLIHDREDRGASDTTPLFLMATAIFRRVTGEEDFLSDAVERSRLWMEYQSPDDRVIVGQLPTSDWRDEQWVLGYGLFVNTVVYAYLRLFGEDEKAEQLRSLFNRFVVRGEAQHRHVHEGLVVPHKPYYALWSYKIYSSERFDLLGNSFAIVCGLASRSRSHSIVSWVEAECDAMRANGELAVDLPPCFFPFINPGEPDWRPRYQTYNRPGEYHNGGIWPYVDAFYVVAALAAGNRSLAEEKLIELTRVNTLAQDRELDFGFNEWLGARDGQPKGQDWQTWSASMYVYAAECVLQNRVLFFE
ncbi:MAG TPA: glycoside hydrolase 100 family protein [Spirochaetia bacterium]|nr:glycoside hydrolase 100 family protein [Spirochaetia bacterium]